MFYPYSTIHITMLFDDDVGNDDDAGTYESDSIRKVCSHAYRSDAHQHADTPAHTHSLISEI